MTKRLTRSGNSLALVIDRPLLEALDIDAETELELSTDGDVLVVTPIREGKRKRETGDASPPKVSRPAQVDAPARGMERFRIEVGHQHGVKPGNIVGAIANEAELDAEYIGRIDIRDDHSIVDLPEGMPRELYRHLKSVWVSGQRLNISRLESPTRRKRGAPGKKRSRGGQKHDKRHLSK